MQIKFLYILCCGPYCSKTYSACSGFCSPAQKASVLSFLDIPGLAMVSYLGEFSGSCCILESSLEPFVPALEAVYPEQNSQLYYFQNPNVVLAWVQTTTEESWKQKSSKVISLKEYHFWVLQVLEAQISEEYAGKVAVHGCSILNSLQDSGSSRCLDPRQFRVAQKASQAESPILPLMTSTGMVQRQIRTICVDPMLCKRNISALCLKGISQGDVLGPAIFILESWQQSTRIQIAIFKLAINKS